MTGINFTTAIHFGDRSINGIEQFLEKVDDYFFLSGKKACVIANQSQETDKATVLLDQESPWYMTCLKVVSYLTVAIPIIMLIAKTCLRNAHHFHLIDPKQKLEEGLELSADTWVELEEIIPLIRNGKDDHPELNDKVTFLNKGPKYVFILNSTPNLVFKMDESFYNRLTFCHGTIEEHTAHQRDPYSVSTRHFKNMVKAKEVGIYHGLDKLAIPHAKLYTIKGKTLIAQEYMPVDKTKQEQEDTFGQLSGSNETIKQLGVLVAETGYTGVKPTHAPVMKQLEESQEARQIALVNVSDIGILDSSKEGFFGNSFTPGLIKCLYSPELIDTALDVAERYKIPFPDNLGKDVIKARRLAAIKRENRTAF